MRPGPRTLGATANNHSHVFSARNTNRPMPKPICSVTPGARNFSGASRNEIASTMPSQTKVDGDGDGDGLHAPKFR